MAAATVEFAEGRVAAGPRRGRRLLAGRRATAGAGGRSGRRVARSAGRPGRCTRSSRRSRPSTTCAAARPIGGTRSSPCCAGSWRASRDDGRLHPERQAGRLGGSADHAPRRGTARRSRTHRHQGRLRCRRLRRLHRPARPSAGLRLPGGHGPGRRPHGRDRRGPGRRQRHAGGPADIVSRPWRGAVRHLHARHADGGPGASGQDGAADARRGRGCAGRRAVPLHRLRQDRRCRHGCDGIAARRRRRPAAPSVRGWRGSMASPSCHGPRAVRRRWRSRRCAVDPRRPLALCAGPLHAGRPRAAAPAARRGADGGRRAVERLRHLSRHQGPAGAGRRPGALSRRGRRRPGRRARRRAGDPRRRRADHLDAGAAGCRPRCRDGSRCAPGAGRQAAQSPAGGRRAGAARRTKPSRPAPRWPRACSRPPSSSTPISSPRPAGPSAWAIASRSMSRPRRPTWTATRWRSSCGCGPRRCASCRRPAAAASAASSTSRSSRWWRWRRGSFAGRSPWSTRGRRAWRPRPSAIPRASPPGSAAMPRAGCWPAR